MRNMNRVVLHSSLWDSRARGMWCRGRDFVGSDSTSRTPSTPCHSGLEAYEQRPVRPYFKEGALCTPKPEVSHLSRGEKPARQPQPTPSRSRHLLVHVHSRPATCTNPAPKTGIYIPPAHCFPFPKEPPPPPSERNPINNRPYHQDRPTPTQRKKNPSGTNPRKRNKWTSPGPAIHPKSWYHVKQHGKKTRDTEGVEFTPPRPHRDCVREQPRRAWWAPSRRNRRWGGRCDAGRRGPGGC